MSTPIKISEMDSASALGGTEVVAGVQSSGSVKILISQIGTYVRGLFTTTPATVPEGGTGVATLAAGGIVCGNGTSAVSVVAAAATTEILVGGGASTNPVWTTSTGSGAPVRAISPVLVTPALGTPTSADLTTIAATQAQQEVGTALTAPVTPGRQQYHSSAAKAWAYFDSTGTVPVGVAAYNIASVSDVGTGSWAPQIATDMSTSTFSAFAWGGHVTGVSALVYFCTSIAAGAVSIEAVRRDTGGNADPDTPNAIFFLALGDQA